MMIKMGKKILIVDDDRNFLLSLADGLERYTEFESITSTSGKEALAILEREKIDLIISDLKMEEMDGLQLLTEVARIYPHIPFILMTAYGSPPIQEEARKRGALKYLEKPLTIKELVNAINEVLENIGIETITHVSAIDISQLVFMERKTCTLEIISSRFKQEGTLVFREGELIYAQTGDTIGVKAAVEIFSWEEANIFVYEQIGEEIPNINENLESIIIKALEYREKFSVMSKKEKEGKMAFNYEKLLEELREVPGYKASAVFNINGEQIIFNALKDEERTRKYFLQMTSLFAAGSRATEKTGAGKMDFIETDSEIGKFLARKGKKFIVMVLLDKEGNIVLAKDALENVADSL